MVGRTKGLGLILILALVAVFALQASDAQATSAATYAIDEVYDNVNGSWFDAAPTFNPGGSYDVTMVGSGESGGILGDYAQEFVSISLFGTSGVVTDWSTFDEPPLISESVLGLPVLSLDHTYTANGILNVPGDAPAGPASLLVWMDSGYLFPPESGTDLYADRPLGGHLASEEFSANVVPEPTSMALLAMGIPGLFFRKRKKIA